MLFGMSEPKTDEEHEPQEVGTTCVPEGQQTGGYDAYAARPYKTGDAPPPVVVQLSDDTTDDGFLGQGYVYRYGVQQARSTHYPTCQACLNELSRPPATRWGRFKWRLKLFFSRSKFLRRVFKIRMSDGKCLPEMHGGNRDGRLRSDGSFDQ
jgi:hypothetical protein